MIEGIGVSAAGQDNHHVTARFKDIATFSTTSTSFVDATDYTVNITTTRTGRLFAIWTGHLFNTIVTEPTFARLVIDGTAGSAERRVPSAEASGVTVIASKGSLAAGTYTVKLQIRVNAGTGSANKGSDQDNHCEVIFIAE